jgi:MFS family permease
MSKKFPYGKTFIVGFGFLGISVIWPMFDQFVPLFLQDKLGLTPALALFIMTWDNILNVFVQPWVGERSDHTWNRFGRRKPWIIVGVPIAVTGFILLPIAQTVPAIMVYILITNFGMAIFRSPTVAWLGDLFHTDVRSTANGVINLMGGVGGLLAYFGGGMLYDAYGSSAPFIGGAILLILATGCALIFVREPRQLSKETKDKGSGFMANMKEVFTNPDKSGLFVLLSIMLWFIAYNALSAGLSSFAVFTLGMKPGQASIYAGSMTISFILLAIPGGLIASKLGRRRTIQIGLAGLTLLFIGGFAFVHNPISLVILLVIGGACWAMVNVNSLPLVYDHGDETKIGAYTGLYYFASQTAAVIGPSLGGLLVDILDDNYRWLWLFSSVFMALAWLTMRGVTSQVANKTE